jgi:hypothetical protein
MSRKLLIAGLVFLAALILWAALTHYNPSPQTEAISFFDLPVTLQAIWAASGMSKDLEFYKVTWQLDKDRLTNDEIVSYAKRSFRGDVTIVKLETQGKTYVALTYHHSLQSDKLDKALSAVFVRLNAKPPVYAIAS